MRPLNAFPRVIYLLHFDAPLHKALHYLGQTKLNRLEQRLREHAQGRGASITRALAARGIGFTLVRTWPMTATDMETKMKRRGHFKRLCPLCSPDLPQPEWPPHFAANDQTDLEYRGAFEWGIDRPPALLLRPMKKAGGGSQTDPFHTLGQQ